MSSNFNYFHSFSPIRIRAPLTLDDDSFSSSSEIEFSYEKPGRIRAGNTIAIPSDCDTVPESEASEAESDSRFFCRDYGRVSGSLSLPFLEFQKMGEMEEDLPQFRPIAQLSMDDDTFESLVSEEDVDHEFDYRLLSIAPLRVNILESDEDEGADHESLGHCDCDSLSDKEIDCVEFIRDSISSPMEYVKHVVEEDESLLAAEKQELQDEIREECAESMAVSDIDEQREESMGYLSTINDEQLEEHAVDSIESISDIDMDKPFEHLRTIVDPIDGNHKEPVEKHIVDSIDVTQEESIISTPDSVVDEPVGHLKTIVGSIDPNHEDQHIVVLLDVCQERAIGSIPNFDIDEPMEHLKTIIDSIDANIEELIKDEQLKEQIVDSIDVNEAEPISEPAEHLKTIVDSKQLDEPKETSVALEITKGSEDQMLDLKMDENETTVYEDGFPKEDYWGDWDSCIVLGETRVRQREAEEEILSLWEANGRSVEGVFRFMNGMKITLSDTSGFGSVDTETRLIMLYVVDILDSIARAWDDLSLTKLLAQFFSLSEVQRSFGIPPKIMPVLEDIRDTWEYPNGEDWRTKKLMSCYLLNDGYDDETVNGCIEKGFGDTCGKGVSVGKKRRVTWQALVGVGLGSGATIRVGMNHTCRGVVGVKTTNSWLHISVVTLAPLLSSVCRNVFSL